jgi:hypothetical protein
MYAVLNPNTGRLGSNILTVDVVIPDRHNGLPYPEISDVEAGLLTKVKDVVDPLADNYVTTDDILATEAALGATYSGERKYDPDTDSFETYENWFRSTRRGDSRLLELDVISFAGTYPSKIPLGFRLKDSNITLASLLNQVVFFDPNGTLDNNYFSGIV